MFMRSGYRAQTRSVDFASGLRTPSPTQHHHRAAHVLIGARDRPRRLDLEACGLCLALQLRAPQLRQDRLVALTHELDHPLLLRFPHAARAVASAQDAPFALDHDLAAAHLYPDRAAAVKKPVDVSAVSSRTNAPVTAVARPDPREDRACEQPAAAQVCARAAQERAALIAIAQQLDRVHWHHAQAELASGQRERARVRVRGLYDGPAAATFDRAH